MALCRDCHRTPPVQVRPGVYLADGHPSAPLTIEERRRVLAANQPNIPTTGQ